MDLYIISNAQINFIIKALEELPPRYDYSVLENLLRQLPPYVFPRHVGYEPAPKIPIED